MKLLEYAIPAGAREQKKPPFDVYVNMMIVMVCIIGAPFFTYAIIRGGGAISFQDGQYNYCMSRGSMNIDIFLYQHYNGGRILADIYDNNFFPSEAHVALRNVIYQGNNQPPLWQESLAHPEQVVQWVITTARSTGNAIPNLVAERINVYSPGFNKYFELVAVNETNGGLLFHLRGLPPLPNRPPPPMPNIC